MKVLSFAFTLILFIPFGCKKSSRTGISTSEKKWMVTTVAGDGSPHFADGPALLSEFSAPLDVAATPTGVLYVADALNHRIRKIANGQVTTFAGFGREDTTSGKGITAGFAAPIQIASDGFGNLYTLDIHDFRVRKINSDALVSVIAGSGIRGFANGRADAARFGECSGIVVDGSGNIFIADFDSRRIRKISTSGVVTTVAGNDSQGFVNANGEAADFFSLGGIVLDKQGNLFVADWNRVRKISPGGDVTTFVGRDASGFSDGGPLSATFTQIADMAIDNDDNIYVTDENHIRKITPQGQVSTIAGSSPGYRDGEGANAQFNGADGLGIDTEGNIYVAESHNNRIRKISFK
jgi:hypothetical protein